MVKVKLKIGGKEGRGDKQPAVPKPSLERVTDPRALYIRWGEMGANAAEIGKYGEDPATDFVIQRTEYDLLLSPFIDHESAAVRTYAQDIANAILMNGNHTLDEELGRDRETLLTTMRRVRAGSIRNPDQGTRAQIAAITQSEKYRIDRGLEASHYESIIRSMTLQPMRRSLGVTNAALRASDIYLFPERRDAEALIYAVWGSLPGTQPVRVAGLLPMADPGNPDYERAADSLLKMVLEPMLTDFVVDIQEDEFSMKVARNLFDVGEEEARAWLKRLVEEAKIENYVATFLAEDAPRGFGRDKSLETYLSNEGQERIFQNVKDASYSVLKETDEDRVRQVIGGLTRQLFLFRDGDLGNAHALGIRPVNASPILRVIGEYRGLPSKVISRVIEHDPVMNPSIGYVTPTLRKT